ncbi:MAG: serine/threonine-protein kinase, partial [Acidobacteriota bacterium]
MGQTIDGRYTVTGLIGEGGMGTVYRAQHTRIGRMVAIKCLREEYARDQRAVQGFFNEAMTAATLHHPNIVEATDMGELPSGVPYLVLELLDGRSLHDELDYQGRLSVRRAMRIAQQIAAGVSAAHEAGIIHRDLKSDNVFLIDRDTNPDFVKIFDFGVAHVLGKAGGDNDHVVGTPEFIAPEQITDPTNVDTRVDVYAVGAILYHMLSGKKPYSELSLPVPELLAHIAQHPPAQLAGVPEDVRLLVEDAMARDRDRRIQSLADLAARMKVIVPHTQSSPALKVAQVAPAPAPAVTPPPSA